MWGVWLNTMKNTKKLREAEIYLNRDIMYQGSVVNKIKISYDHYYTFAGLIVYVTNCNDTIMINPHEVVCIIDNDASE